ncbi:MAG: transglutaminase-like domain-containing protein [Pirellula sp.]|jgi:hypothetical protein|nr:transglutaminase-like domain-containing protein [Pirellula sp.]
MQLNRLHKLMLLLAAIQAAPLAAQDSSPADVANTDIAKDVKESKDSKDGKSKASARAKTSPKKVDPNVIVGRVVEGTNGVNLFAPRSMDMQFGMRFATNDNSCTSLLATIPFPMEWPEQTIEVVGNQMPDNVAWQFRDLPAGAKQLIMRMNSLGPNNTLELVVQVKVVKSFINAPTDTSIFRIPKSSAKELKWYLGSSPYIDIDLSEIKRTAKKIEDSKPENAWRHVEMIYDWVRDNIEYRNGDLRQIKEALKDKQGDCEEMTGIFVALCRASDIPARCVWIPEHCYPEFYLEDQDGVGYWFPCQAAGERQFGQMHDYRPILQKGDRFKVPEEVAMQRYVSHFFSCKQRPTIKGGRDLVVEPVLDLGPLEAEVEALRQQQQQQSR